MKVQELLIASQAKLRECGISDPIRDARLLLADCLELRTQNLYLLNDSYISEIKISKFFFKKENCISNIRKKRKRFTYNFLRNIF